MHASKLNQEAVIQFSQSYTKLLVDEFFGENKDITGQQIVSLSPIKQVNFFVLKVLFEEWQEEAKKFESPYFDYSNEEVSQALTTLANSLSKNIKVGKSEFIPLVEKAVSDTLEMMYSPALFYISEIKKLPNKEIAEEFKSLGKYFKFQKELFDQCLLNIQNCVSSDVSVLESIITSTIEDFELDARELEEIEVLFNAILKLDVLEIAEPEKEEPEEELKSEDELNFFDSLEDNNDLMPEPSYSHEPAAVQAAVVSEEIDPVIETIPNVIDTPIVKEDISEPKNINDQFSESDIQTLNDKFDVDEKTETIASVHEQKPVSELVSSININQRYMFVNDLFEGNEIDYNQALDEIEHSDSFDSSVELLVQSYSKKYMWDMNSDEVKELLKVIFKRFR